MNTVIHQHVPCYEALKLSERAVDGAAARSQELPAFGGGGGPLGAAALRRLLLMITIPINVLRGA
ncbi:hypothetical protein MDUV_54000 [Mycolicibacterium duvalii]|uniref:Uncharacterized protein n=1 Tax=Mycolicibacterium duvalii TaxID=39688 RepID=A0A7I7K8M3_9MYCO|nr:hypothetical protein MDUV_54000 [Mycolicibacterium duvalii]